MPPLPRQSSYWVGAGWPIWFLGFLLIAFAAFMLFAISVLEGQGLNLGVLFIFFPWPAFGVLILWFATRRAEISDAEITVRMISRSITIRWDELAHVQHSNTWLVIKDVYERSYRLGPFPRRAEDFERDVHVRRPRAISPVVAWAAEHGPGERAVFAGFRTNDRLTARQAVGITLLATLSMSAPVAIVAIPDFTGPLRKSGMTPLTADCIVFCALLLLLGLGGVVASWLTRR